MDKTFHEENRQKLYRSLGEGSLFLCFAGQAPHQSADADYPFFANRNFVYLTGLDGLEPHDFILMAEKADGTVTETMFILPPRPSGRAVDGPPADPGGGGGAQRCDPHPASDPV